MNLNSLSNQTMLFLSDAWLNAPDMRALLAARALTAALIPELQIVHDELAEKQGRRARIFAQLGEITEDLLGHDQVHDRKARAMYSIVQGLAEASDQASKADRFRALLTKLFPEGLTVVQRSYIDEAGAVIEMQRRIDDDVLGFMTSVRIGDQTLADLYREWIAAGMALGQLARERARLQYAIRKEGTASAEIDTRAVRQRWIRTVLTLLNIVDMLPLSDEEREQLLAPLERSVSDATRNRGSEPGQDPDEVLPPDPDEADQGENAGSGGDAAPGDDTGTGNQAPDGTPGRHGHAPLQQS